MVFVAWLHLLGQNERLCFHAHEVDVVEVVEAVDLLDGVLDGHVVFLEQPLFESRLFRQNLNFAFGVDDGFGGLLLLVVFYVLGLEQRSYFIELACDFGCSLLRELDAVIRIVLDLFLFSFRRCFSFRISACLLLIFTIHTQILVIQVFGGFGEVQVDKCAGIVVLYLNLLLDTQTLHFCVDFRQLHFSHIEFHLNQFPFQFSN